MYTATTPKLTFEIEDGVDLMNASRIIMSLNDKNGQTLLEKDLTAESETVASVVLSQEETLALPIGTVTAQLNYLYEVDNELRRGATDKSELSVERNNKNEVVIQ